MTKHEKLLYKKKKKTIVSISWLCIGKWTTNSVRSTTFDCANEPPPIMQDEPPSTTQDESPPIVQDEPPSIVQKSSPVELSAKEARELYEKQTKSGQVSSMTG